MLISYGIYFKFCNTLSRIGFKPFWHGNSYDKDNAFVARHVPGENTLAPKDIKGLQT